MRKLLTLLAIMLMVFSSVALAHEDAADAQGTDTDVIDELDSSSLDELAAGVITEDDVAAVEDELDEDPGAMQGDGLGYAFKRFGEGLSLAFTFSQKAKAEREMQLASLRLREAKKAALQNRGEAVREAQEKYNELVSKARQRIAAAESEGALQEAVLFEEQLHRQEAMAQAIRERLEKSDLNDADKERIKERLEAVREHQRGVKEQVKERRGAIKERLKAVKNISDDDLQDVEDEAHVAAELGAGMEAAQGQRVSAEQFLRILDKKIAEAEEMLASAENASEDASNAVELAKQLRDEAKAAFDAGDMEKVRELALEARRLVMAPILRSSLKAVIRHADDGMEMREERREELKEKLEEHRVKLEEIRVKRREDAEKLQERIREKLETDNKTLREELKEKLERHRELAEEHREKAMDDVDEAASRVAERMENAKEQLNSALEVRTRVKEELKDGVVVRKTEERVRNTQPLPAANDDDGSEDNTQNKDGRSKESDTGNNSGSGDGTAADTAGKI